MKGRGVRVVGRIIRTSSSRCRPTCYAGDLLVIVDCVGVTEGDLNDTEQLDRKRHAARSKELLEHVAAGGHGSRRHLVAGGGGSPCSIGSAAEELQRRPGGLAWLLIVVLTGALVAARSIRDGHVAKAREMFGLDGKAEPKPEQIKKAAAAVAKVARSSLLAGLKPACWRKKRFHPEGAGG